MLISISMAIAILLITGFLSIMFVGYIWYCWDEHKYFRGLLAIVGLLLGMTILFFVADLLIS